MASQCYRTLEWHDSGLYCCVWEQVCSYRDKGEQDDIYLGLRNLLRMSITEDWKGMLVHSQIKSRVKTDIVELVNLKKNIKTLNKNKRSLGKLKCSKNSVGEQICQGQRIILCYTYLKVLKWTSQIIKCVLFVCFFVYHLVYPFISLLNIKLNRKIGK